MHHCDAVFKSFFGIFKVYFLALKIYFSAVLGVYAEQALHKGGFSRAVFTHKGVNCSGFNRKAYIVKRLYAGEGFFDVLHSKKNGFVCVFTDAVIEFFVIAHKNSSPVRLVYSVVGAALLRLPLKLNYSPVYTP